MNAWTFVLSLVAILSLLVLLASPRIVRWAEREYEKQHPKKEADDVDREQ